MNVMVILKEKQLDVSKKELTAIMDKVAIYRHYSIAGM